MVGDAFEAVCTVVPRWQVAVWRRAEAPWWLSALPWLKLRLLCGWLLGLQLLSRAGIILIGGGVRLARCHVDRPWRAHINDITVHRVLVKLYGVGGDDAVVTVTR